MLTTAFLCILIPSALTVYNCSVKTTKKQKTIRAVIVTSIVIVIGIGLICGVKFGLKTTTVDYHISKLHINNAETSESIWIDFKMLDPKTIGIDTNISWFTALFIILSFFGSFMFCILGGFGLASMPLENISSF